VKAVNATNKLNKLLQQKYVIPNI